MDARHWVATALAPGLAIHSVVMVGLVPTIHVFLCRQKTWMVATSATMTVWGET